MTIARTLSNGGLNSLTALNRRLIADQHVDEAVVEAAEESGLLGFGPTTGQPPDPDAGDADDEAAEVRGRFSIEDPFGFNRVKEWIEQRIFGGSATGRSPLIGAFVNEWAETISPDATNPFPDDLADRLLGNEDFQAGAGWLPVREQLDELPPTFRTNLDGVDFTVVNDPLTGPEFVEERLPEEIVPARPITPVRRFPTSPNEAASDRAMRRAAEEELGPGEIPVVPGDAASDRAIGRAAAERAGGVEGGELPASDRAIRRAIDRNRAETPFIDEDALIDALQPPSSGGRGRGGGGGGTRRELVFDKDQLLSQVADRWNSWMLSPDEAPMGQITSWVNSYIREAKAFWSGKGGQLDFDTYITNKLEEHPRFKQIYRDKQPGETPEQFLQKFMAPIASLGMGGEFTRAQTERAVTSQTGPEAQFERVSRTRDVQVANQGEFSQRLAQTLRGIGVG